MRETTGAEWERSAAASAILTGDLTVTECVQARSAQAQPMSVSATEAEAANQDVIIKYN